MDVSGNTLTEFIGVGERAFACVRGECSVCSSESLGQGALANASSVTHEWKTAVDPRKIARHYAAHFRVTWSLGHTYSHTHVPRPPVCRVGDAMTNASGKIKCYVKESHEIITAASRAH